MNNVIIELENKINLPRELWNRIICFTGIYKNIWKNNIKKNFHFIRKHRPRLIWTTVYNLKLKMYFYYLYKYKEDGFLESNKTLVVTNYSEDKYKLEEIDYWDFLRSII